MNRLLTLLLSILTIFCVQAQKPFGNQDNEVPPVKWSGTARLTSPTEGVVTLTASMADGWHLYGVDMPENGPKPTRFKFEVAKGLELIGKLTAGSKPLFQNRPDVQHRCKLLGGESGVHPEIPPASRSGARDIHSLLRDLHGLQRCHLPAASDKKNSNSESSLKRNNTTLISLHHQWDS